jgi:hypothetical protein
MRVMETSFHIFAQLLEDRVAVRLGQDDPTFLFPLATNSFILGPQGPIDPSWHCL